MEYISHYNLSLKKAIKLKWLGKQFWEFYALFLLSVKTEESVNGDA